MKTKTKTQFHTLLDMGISIEVLGPADGNGAERRLNEATEYQPMSIAEAVAWAKSEAHDTPDACSVSVSVDLGVEGWAEIWTGEYDHENERWSWE